jgi:hypothetical protein
LELPLVISISVVRHTTQCEVLYLNLPAKPCETFNVGIFRAIFAMSINVRQCVKFCATFPSKKNYNMQMNEWGNLALCNDRPEPKLLDNVKKLKVRTRASNSFEKFFDTIFNLELWKKIIQELQTKFCPRITDKMRSKRLYIGEEILMDSTVHRYVFYQKIDQ